jgi:hypothetical protein
MIGQLPGLEHALRLVSNIAGGLRQLYDVDKPFDRGFVFKDMGNTYGNRVDFKPIAFPFPSRQISVINRPTSAGALILSLFDNQKSTISSGERGVTVEVGQQIDLPIVAFYFQIMAADANGVLLNYEVRGYR